MTKKTRIRIGIIVAIICLMGFSDRSFAADIKQDGITVFGITLNYIVSAMAWLWVFFANIAGEFLTNKWVYGEFLGLDVLLWKYWNIVKNFANFGLGFYFIYIVFKGLISTGKDSIEQTLKNNLLWLLIAGIGIQASWFLTAFFIDLSTVTMAAAGSFPASVTSNSPYTETALKQRLMTSFNMQNGEVKDATEINLFKNRVGELLKIETGYIELNTGINMETMLDNILPKAEDVSGPLYFIGFSILNTNSVPTIKQGQEGIKTTIFNTIIQGGTTIIYAIELLVLCVIALMRILYLWMFIILSPLVILLRCVEKSGQKTGGKNKSLESFLKTLKIETFLINVFKPTIVVLGLGIAVIVTSFMTNIVTDPGNTSFTVGGVSFSSIKNTSTSDQSKGDATYTTTMNHNLFNFTLSHVGKPLLELIISILTIYIVYQIIKLSVKIGNGEDFLGKNIGKLQEGVGDILGKTPIMPVAGYDEKGNPTTHFLSAGSVFGGNGEKSLLEKKLARYQDTVNDEYYRQNNLIDAWFDKTGTKAMSQSDQNNIEKAVVSKSGIDILKTYKDEIKNLGEKPENEGGLPSGYGYGLILAPGASNKRWQDKFMKWLEGKRQVSGTQYDSVRNAMINWWNDSKNKDKTLEKLFKADNNKTEETKRVKAYVALFGLDSSITTWKDLKNADFSVKE